MEKGSLSSHVTGIISDKILKKLFLVGGTNKSKRVAILFKANTDFAVEKYSKR